ncbi:MAG: DNA repair protein RadC [candidate division WOR-3 bacterium]
MKTNYSKTVKDLPRVERPREKLMKYGVENLSNTELLAILLRSGRKGENVIDLANRILKHFGAQNLPNLSFNEIKKIAGVGPAKACEIIACFELGKRLLKSKKVCLYMKPEDVWNELKDVRGLKKEHFIIFYLDVRNQEIKREIISIGSLNASLVHPREVFDPAIRHSAAQIILAHNHPSDNPEPSDDDLAITKRLVEAGKILGIEIIDHIIVAKSRFYSFKENGLI